MGKFIIKHKTFFVSLLCVYVFLVGVYYFTSVGLRPGTLYLNMRRYISCAIVVALAISLWRQQGLPWKGLVPYGIIGVLWVLVYPACYWLAYHTTFTHIDKHYDQSFGAYIFTFFVCLRLLIWQFDALKNKRVIKYIFGFLQTVALIIPFVEIIYYVYYKMPITQTTSVLLLQTNPAEAKEYLLLNFGYIGIALAVVSLMAVFLYFSKMNGLDKFAVVNIHLGKLSSVLLVSLLVCTGIYGTKIFKNTGVMHTYYAAREYFDRVREFNRYHDQNFKDLNVTPSKPAFAKPSTVIMVIGESASSIYMSAYHDVKNDNTPWLRAKKEDFNFIVFEHVYSSVAGTVPALERALTEKNQYNNIEFSKSLTILDIAKLGGYKTYWFSNQGYIDDADTQITLVAKTADYKKWLCEDKNFSGKYQYDVALLECLKQVDPNENNFIVLHINGSHEDAINRYPQEFAKFSKPNVYDSILNYDDALAYTDYFLEKVYKYGTEKLNMQAMLYFSDHGADPHSKRSPYESSFPWLKIPMFVYVSDEYKVLYPDAYATYKANREKYFTNDMMYEVVCDLLRIESNHFQKENSILNANYKYTPETLTTNLGRTRLSED